METKDNQTHVFHLTSACLRGKKMSTSVPDDALTNRLASVVMPPFSWLYRLLVMAMLTPYACGRMESPSS